MKKLTAISVLSVLMSIQPALAATPVVDAGDHTLIAGTANQSIQITVTGGDNFAGFNAGIQIGDGATGPTINSVDGTTGIMSTWDAFDSLTVTASQRNVAGSKGDFPPSNVAANGLLLILNIDTTGITSGRFGILLTNNNAGSTQLVDTAANEVPTTFVNGTIAVGDNPLVIWDGGDAGNNTNLTNDLNWLHKAAPEAGDTLQFGGTTGTDVNFDQTANTAYHSITFDSTAQGFVFTGNDIGLQAGGSITNDSALAGSFDFGDGPEPIGQVFFIGIKPAGNATIDAAAGDLTFEGNISLNGSSTLTFTGANLNDVLGNITGSSATVAKNGTGTLILAGTNSFNTLDVNAGTVELEGGTALSNTGIVTLDGGTLAMVYDGNAFTNKTLSENTETMGALNAQVGTILNLRNNILILKSASTLAGTITDTDSSGTPLAHDVNGNDIGTAGGIAINNNGTTTITGNNDFSLGTIIGNNNAASSLLGATLTAPTVVAGHNNAFGDGDILFNSGTLNSNNDARTLANRVSIGGNVSFTGSELTLSGDMSLIGDTDGADYGSNVTDTSRTFTVNNNTEISGGISTFQYNPNTDTDTQLNIDLVKAGTGILKLSGNNSNFDGDVTVNAGTLQIDNGSAINDTATVTVNAGGDFQVLADETVGFLKGTSGSTVQLLNSADLTLGATAEAPLANTIYAGNITGNGGLIINADAPNINEVPGIVTLSGNNSFGSTSINSGALLISGNTTSTQVTVSGILGGDGTITATNGVTVASGGEIVAVDGTTPLTDSFDTFNIIGNVDVQTGGQLTVDIGLVGGVATSDKLNITGNLTLANGSELNIHQIGAEAMLAGKVFDIASVSGLITDNGLNLNEDISGFGFTLANNGTDVTLTSFEQVDATWITGSGNFSVENNWNNAPDGVQTNVDNLGLIFTGTSTGAAIAVVADEGPYINVESITFDNTTDIFTISGSSISFNNSISAAITNNTAQIQTINNDLNTGNDVLDINAASGNLVLGGLINTNNSGLNVFGANDSTISNVISGAGTLAKSGTGVLTLNAANTYTGNTTLSNGTIVVGNDQAFGTTGTLNIAGGTLQSNLDGRIIANDLNITNNFEVSGNTLVFTGNGNLNSGSRSITVNNSATTLNGSLTNGTLVKEGAGDLNIGAGLAMDGLTINQGTVNLTTSAAQGGPDTVNSVTDLILNDAGVGAQSQLIIPLSPSGAMDFYVESLAGDTNSLVQVGSNTRFWITGDKTTTFNGVLNADYFELSEIHDGQLTLTNNANVADKVHVRQGTLAITGTLDNTQMVIFDGGTVLIANGVTDAGSTFNIFEEGAQIGAIGGDATVASSLSMSDAGFTVVEVDENTDTVGDGNNLTFTGAVLLNGHDTEIEVQNTNPLDITTLTLAGAIDDGDPENDDNVRITKSGNGQLNLTNANDFGGVSLQAGVLGIGNDNALGYGTFSISGGTVRALGNGTIANQIDVSGDFAITGDATSVLSGNVNLIGANRNITISNTGSTTFSGNITNGDLTKSGTQTLTLSGTNDFTNGITVTEGTLRLNHANATSDDDDLTVSGTGSVEFNDDTVVDVLTGSGTGTLAIGTSNSLTANSGSVSNVISGDGTTQLVKNGAGTLALTGVNTYAGGTTLRDGTIEINNSSALGTGDLTVTFNGGTLTSTVPTLNLANDITVATDLEVDQAAATELTLSGDISGTRGIAKEGDGLLILTGTNTYQSPTNINAGTLRVSGGSALDDSNHVTVNDGATFQIYATETIGSLTGESGSTLFLGGGLNTNSDTVNYSDTYFRGDITGNSQLNKQGTGTLTLNNDDATSLGSTAFFLISGGTLALEGGDAIDDNNGQITVNGGATLQLIASETIGSLIGAGTVDTNGNTFTFGSTANPTFSGDITDSGAVIYNGTGTAELSGDNTFTGGFTVSNGVMNLTGSLDTTGITVSGGTLILNNAGGDALLDTANIEVGTGAQLQVNVAEIIHDLDLGSGAALTLNDDLTLLGDGTSGASLQGNITGVGNLNITGESIANLSGTNASTGTTTVSGISAVAESTYNLSGISTAGDLVVNNFGNVNLTGTAGNTTVNSGGALLTGDGVIDTATINGNFILNSGGVLGVDISNNAGTLTNDLYNVTGNATFADNAIIAVNDIGPSTIVTGNNFDIMTYGGALTATKTAGVLDQLKIQESLSDVAFKLADDGAGTLTLSAITVTNITWDGEGNDGLFSTLANWDDEVNGVTSTNTGTSYSLEGQGIVFSGASNNGGVITADNGGDANVLNYSNIASLNFTNTTEDMILSGLDLLLINGQTTDITNDSANNHTIIDNITTGDNTTTIDANTGNLTFGGTITNNDSIIVTGSSTTTINGAGTITGTGSLAKTGTGTLILGNANTYTGGTTLSNGILQIANDGALGSGVLTINGGELNANGVRTLTNTVTLNNDVTFSGSNIDLQGNVTNTATNTLTINNAQTTLSGDITGGGLGKSGAGTLVLSGANDIDSLTLNQGQVTLGSTTAVDGGTAVNLAVTGTTLNMLGGDIEIASLAGVSGSTVETNNNKIIISGSATTNFAGAITNDANGRLDYSGSGSQELSGTNTYTGATTVTSAATGTLAISGSVAGDVILEDGEGTLLLDTNSVGGNITINGGKLGATDPNVNIGNNIQINDGFTYVGTSTMDLSGPINLGVTGGGNSVLIYVNPQDATETGVLNLNGTITQDAGVDHFTKAGAGQMNITGDNNTLTGQFGLTNGTLGIGHDNALGSMSMQISGNSTIQALTDGMTMVNDIELFSDLNFTGNASEAGVEQLTIGDAASTFALVLGDFNENNAFSLNVDDTVEVILNPQIISGSIKKTGDGVLNLNGDNDFSYQVPGFNYAGFLAVNEGVVNINSSDAMNTDDVLSIGGGTLNLNADLAVAGLSGNDTGNGTLNLNSHDLTFGGDNLSRSFYFSFAGDDNSQLIKEGTGEYGFYGASTFSGQFQLNGGNIALENDDALGTGTLNINNAGSIIRTYINDRIIANNVVVNNDFTINGMHNFDFTGDFDLSGGDADHQLTVDMPNGDVTTLSGALSGGDLTKLGTGTMTLSGNNDFVNGLTVNAGLVNLNGENTLAADDDLTIGASGSVALGSNQTLANLNGEAGSQLNIGENILTVTQDTDGTFTGNITDGNAGGGLTKEGDAKLTLWGTNTFTGPITINTGTLAVAGGSAIADTAAVAVNNTSIFQLDADETIGTLTGTGSTLLDSTDLTLGTAANFTYGGTFDGLGNVNYNGTGTMTLTGQSSFDGILYVTSGSVNLNSGLQTLAGSIAASGSSHIYGEGPIGGDLSLSDTAQWHVGNNGSNNTGNFTVGGNATLAAGTTSIFRIDYDNTGGAASNNTINPAANDFASITGNLNVANGAIINYSVQDDDDNATEGDTFNFFVVNGDLILNSVTTTTAADDTTFTVDGPALIDEHIEITNDGTYTYLKLVIDNLLNFEEATVNSVNPSIGRALVVVAAAADGGDPQAQALVDALGNLTEEQLNAFVQQVNDGVALNVLASNNVQVLIQNFTHVLSDHLSARRTNMPVLANTHAGSDLSMLAGLTDDPHTLAQVAANELSEEKQQQVRQAMPMNQWAAFGKIYGIFSEQDTASGRTGYSSDGIGIQLGMDYQANENLIVGLTFDYAKTTIDFNDNYGNIDADSFRIGPFASYFTENWFVDASLTYGLHSNESTRNDISTGKHEADYDASDVTFYLGGGYHYQLGDNWQLTPTASMRYTYYTRDSYSESGVGGLTFDSYDVNKLYTRLGANLSYQLKSMDMLLIPEISLGWEHEYLNDGDSANAAFAGNGAFTVNTGNPAEDSIFFGAGLTAIIDEQWTTYIRYEGNVSSDGQTNAITGGVRFDF